MAKNEFDKLCQSSIKNENTLAIFREISASGGISRAEISQKTGLSLMTVGKVADSLSKEGIIRQAKPATGSAGRRAGMLTVSDGYFILAIDISSMQFRASIMDLALNQTDSMIYPYNDSLFPEDNLIIFFRDTGSLLMKHLMTKKLVGTGICVCGDYDEESDTVISPAPKHLQGIKISDTMKRSIGFSPNKIMNSVTAAAFSCISELGTDMTGCAINLSIDQSPRGCVILGGKVLQRPSHFEDLCCKNGKTVAENLSDRSQFAEEEQLAAHIGSALRPLVSVLCSDSVFVSSTEHRFSEWFSQFLEKELCTKDCSPKLVFENSQKSRIDMGISELILNKMIKEL